MAAAGDFRWPVVDISRWFGRGLLTAARCGRPVGASNYVRSVATESAEDSRPMDVDDIAFLRANSSAWRLLAAEHAPLILSFAGQVFVEDNSGP